ncbi:MAG: pyruvate formate lyase family protein [Armatimonadota bacterium]
MKEKDTVSRRDFLKASAGVVALGTGIISLGGAASADNGVKTAVNKLDLSSPFQTPNRLSDATRALAKRGLSGEFGRSTVGSGHFIHDCIDVTGMSEEMKYAHSIRLIGEMAPVRIIPGEKIVGSAVYLEAVQHVIPIYQKPSVSHTTIGWGKALKLGYKEYRRKIEDRLARGGLDETGREFLTSARMCLDAATLWHSRYVKELKLLIAKSSGEEQAEYQEILRNLQNVPENPPTSFREAVQSLWFMYAFNRLCGTWSGIGRIDEMLGPYLKQDLQEGRITLDEARELIAHFWIKGTEWVGVNPFGGTGDAQHYQNIILAGVDENGNEVTNEVTYLILDVVEELHISDFPIAVRINKKTPEKLLRRMAEVQRHGGGIVAMYNEDVVIKALHDFGYPLEEARSFTNDGCWEVLVPGKTVFSYAPFDGLSLLQDTIGLNGQPLDKPYDTFDDLYADFTKRLTVHLDSHNNIADIIWKDNYPATVVSIFVDDCIERARGYYGRGPKYAVFSPHIGGMANVANSLLAIKKLVYDEKMYTLPEFLDILRSDWNGYENLRKMVLNRIEFYGSDNDEADAMMRRVFDDYTALVARVRERSGVKLPAGISTFGREIEWRAHRKATADGHHLGEILATNFSPSPGTDKHGPTSALKSYCKMDFTKLPGIGTIELKVLPSSVKGDAGVKAMVGLMRSFVKLGGCFMHIDVVDTAMLIDAQRHPEKYPNLSVRIAGWSARFATMNKDWQDMVINRSQQVM